MKWSWHGCDVHSSWLLRSRNALTWALTSFPAQHFTWCYSNLLYESYLPMLHIRVCWRSELQSRACRRPSVIRSDLLTWYWQIIWEVLLCSAMISILVTQSVNELGVVNPGLLERLDRWAMLRHQERSEGMRRHQEETAGRRSLRHALWMQISRSLSLVGCATW